MTTDINRAYSTRRLGIVNALVEKLKGIDGNGEFNTDVYGNVSPRLKFWDEVNQFPAIHLNAGSESRVYQSAGFKDRFLSVSIRVYVEAEDAVEALEELLEDIETVIEANSRLEYRDRRGLDNFTHQITIVSIDTDEGVLEPLGVGEILLEVRY
jgi:putative lipoic acid-binding regulatory protein